MTTLQLLTRLRPHVAKSIQSLSPPTSRYVLFFSISNGQQRAEVSTVAGSSFGAAWRKGTQSVLRLVAAKKIKPCWLRVDWVESVEELTWLDLRARLNRVKRNYFRHGISLDSGFKHAFLETELNANAMLYGGGSVANAVVNEGNFSRYASIRHGLRTVEFPNDGKVYTFSTKGAFASSASPEVHYLDGTERNAGRRGIQNLTALQVRELIGNSSAYLSTQIDPQGRFQYGWHPCFDRPINAYNSLRHASTLYSMAEALEVTGDVKLRAAIERGLDYLAKSLIKVVEAPAGTLAFLTEENGEIKLGGNAVCLLALVKYSEVTKTRHFLPLLEQLALGILHMQDQATGQFVHVLSYPSLEVKDPFRIIYYDGEATFGLMRLYGLTGDARWLDAVEKAFGHFIAAEHWKTHDHWLAYSVNELTRHKPNAAYYRFGIQNFADHLDFVIERITTFPTLLELMMAAETMVTRLQGQPEYRHLLWEVDLDKFYKALHARAHHLLNGHFWPELAMFFANPARITGSFFIRHHAFRARIDDVEHYLSGFVAYLKHLEIQKPIEWPEAKTIAH